jgi:hypothetical protein
VPAGAQAPVVLAERLDGDVEEWCGARLVLGTPRQGVPHVLMPRPCRLFVDGFEPRDDDGSQR